MALTKIEDKEIMTVWEARNKYADKHIMMIGIAGENQMGDGQKGYVVYVHDKHIERLDIPEPEMQTYMTGEGMPIFTLGVMAEPYPQVGGIELHATV